MYIPIEDPSALDGCEEVGKLRSNVMGVYCLYETSELISSFTSTRRRISPNKVKGNGIIVIFKETFFSGLEEKFLFVFQIINSCCELTGKKIHISVSDLILMKNSLSGEKPLVSS